MSTEKEKANTSDKQGTEIRQGAMPIAAGSPATLLNKAKAAIGMASQRVSPETAEERAVWQSYQLQAKTEHMAERIALAILSNPKVEQLLGRNPCDPGRCGDHPNAGAALVHVSRRLAEDYLAAQLGMAKASPLPDLDEHAEPGQSV